MVVVVAATLQRKSLHTAVAQVAVAHLLVHIHRARATAVVHRHAPTRHLRRVRAIAVAVVLRTREETRVADSF